MRAPEKIERVLLAEPRGMTAKFIQMFMSANKVSVDRVTNYRAGLSHLLHPSTDAYDALLIDRQLGFGRLGETLAQEARNLGFEAYKPIILFSKEEVQELADRPDQDESKSGFIYMSHQVSLMDIWSTMNRFYEQNRPKSSSQAQ